MSQLPLFSGTEMGEIARAVPTNPTGAMLPLLVPGENDFITMSVLSTW